MNELLRDAQWLRGPGNAATEQEISKRLNLPKSSVREAVIGYVNTGALERTSMGLCRREISAERLVAAVGERYRCELLAMKRILSFSPTLRLGIADQLQTIWELQQSLTPQSERYSRWLELGFEFHQRVQECAGFPDIGLFIRNLMVCVRLGTYRGMESEPERTDSQAEHKDYIALIANGWNPPYDRDSGHSPTGEPKWYAVIEKHIQKSVRPALKSIHMQSDEKFDVLWKSIHEIATSNPADLDKHRQVFH